jgi:hypothetical protein
LSCLAVFDGRQCIGHLMLRGNGVEAFDANNVSLGLFLDQKAAAAAIPSGRAS